MTVTAVTIFIILQRKLHLFRVVVECGIDAQLAVQQAVQHCTTDGKSNSLQHIYNKLYNANAL